MRWVTREPDSAHIRLHCACGWSGDDADVDGWDVQADRDRVVRRCPDCGDTVPEWGAIPSIDGARRLARGSLQSALAEAGYGE